MNSAFKPSALCQHLADQVAEQAQGMERYEAYVAEKIAEGRSIMGLYPLTSEKNKMGFDAWKKSLD